MSAVKAEEIVKPLCWLIGTWKSISAEASYPTMKNPVTYSELLTFSSFGEPLLGYSSLTWLPETKKYMHAEGGHLRIGEDGCTVCLMTAQNLGICSVEDGTVKEKCMELVSSVISHSRLAKHKVVAIARNYSLNDEGKLEYTMQLQTNTTPLTDHLKVVYEKDCD